MKTLIFITLQYLVPQHTLSRIVGVCARATLPWFKTLLIKKFIRTYNVDLSEAVIQEPEGFRCFNDFFCRELQKKSRPINSESRAIISPADGKISQLGAIKAGRIFQAKGQDYSTLELLGGNCELAQEFDDGHFATIYLSPRDYHRVHMPLKGTLRTMTHIPGALFSVNTATAENVPRLFARNERVVTIFDTDIGPMAVVLIGAMIVASIETVWAGQVAPTGKCVSTTDYRNNNALTLEKGQEMGRFKLGSTAIVLLPKDRADWEKSLKPGSAVYMGRKVGLTL